MKTQVVCMAVAVAVIASAAVTAQPGPAAPGNAPRPNFERPGAGFDQLLPLMQGPELERIGQQLKLTEPQKQAIRALAQQKASLIKPLNEQIQPLSKQIQDEMLTSSPDGAKVKGLIAQVQTLRSQIAGHGVDFWIAVRAQLDAAQNEQLTEILKRRLMGGWRRGPGTPGDPGAPGRPGGPGNRPDRPGGPGLPPPEPDPGQ